MQSAQVDMQALYGSSLDKTEALAESASTRKMQKHLGQLRALTEQDPGNIHFGCLLSCLF